MNLVLFADSVKIYTLIMTHILYMRQSSSTYKTYLSGSEGTINLFSLK